jgi:hypothetical protein
MTPDRLVLFEAVANHRDRFPQVQRHRVRRKGLLIVIWCPAPEVRRILRRT